MAILANKHISRRDRKPKSASAQLQNAVHDALQDPTFDSLLSSIEKVQKNGISSLDSNMKWVRLCELLHDQESDVVAISMVTQFGKLLASACENLCRHEIQPDAQRRGHNCPKLKLNFILLVHAILWYHHSTRTRDHLVFRLLEPQVSDILAATAAYPKDDPTYHRHFSTLNKLLTTWNDEFDAKFDHRQMVKFKEILDKASEVSASGEIISKASDLRLTTVSNFDRSNLSTLPATHGDPGIPWYDLPAANFIPHLDPHSSTPIIPQRIRPIRFQSNAQASESVISAVEDLLHDADRLYGQESVLLDESIVAGLNELGDPLYYTGKPDEPTIMKENYYGWSPAFAKRMKERSNGSGVPLSDRFKLNDAMSSHTAANGNGEPRQPRSELDRSPRASARSLNSFNPTNRPTPDSHPLSSRPPPSGLSRAPGFPPNSTNLQTPMDQIDNPFNNHAQPTPPPPPPVPPHHVPANWPRDANGLPIPPPPPFSGGQWPSIMGGRLQQGAGGFQPPPPPMSSWPVPPPPPPPNARGVWSPPGDSRGGFNHGRGGYHSNSNSSQSRGSFRGGFGRGNGRY